MAKNTGVRDEILKLKSQGLNQNQVRLKLGCSGSTVYYHWSDSRKEKIGKLNNKWKKDNFLEKKLSNFIYTTTLKYNGRVETFKKKLNERLATKINNFKKVVKNKDYKIIKTEDVRNHIENHPYCYLTGRKIDINNTTSYHFDHKLPVSKGGDASFDNLGVACREANQAKNDMTVKEFIQLCEEVLTHNGYKIEKPI